MSGAEVMTGPAGQMMRGYEELKNARWNADGAQMLRAKNKFKIKSEALGVRRDLKVFLATQVDDGESKAFLLSEVQLHLINFYRLKRFSILPYEHHRGPLD